MQSGRSMAKSGGMCSSALVFVHLFVVAALTSSVSGGRTHELFAQSTYENDVTPTFTDKAGELRSNDVSGKDEAIPVKGSTTSTAEERTSFAARLPSKDVADELPEATAEFSAAGVQPNAVEAEVPKQEQQQHYRDYRGASTHSSNAAAQGDFIPDAKPWWLEAQYTSYASNPQEKDEQQQQPNGDSDVIPNRYPLGYPTRYQYNPQLNAQGSQAQYTSAQARNNLNGQYTSSSRQYNQGGYPQYAQYSSSNAVPYEATGGGCPAQYWIYNTQRWAAFFNVKTTLGDALGTTATKVFGETTLMQALQNTRQDGYSTLMRTAATAILNSYGRAHYKYTHVQVMEAFSAALKSNAEAASQSATFEEANVSDFADQYNSCT